MSATGQTLHTPQAGAVKVDGGSLTVEGSIFHDNSVVNSSFPSVRRNIHCVSGELTMETLSGETGQRISFRVDQKDSAEDSETCWETADSVWSLAGSVRVEREIENRNRQIDRNLLATANIQNWNETSLELILNESSLSNTLSVEHEWRLRLIFGDGVAGTEWITVERQSRAAEKKAQTTQAMKVLLPIVISVIAALALFTIIVCVLAGPRRGESGCRRVDEHDGRQILQQLPAEHSERVKTGGASFTGTVALGKKEDEKLEEEPHTTAQFLCEAMRCDG
ncbi:hypothetical protein BLNAU_20290 [Blattamonas nauphoetae]|uniref:Uncharacterized protein n=1 Tax=Blattamonas nauphoetae TaxID=2049346 RepID=A0ABQ9X1L0_9EUKA|nr:hypothetical protein BLNAU_20290 [Blattamonas nauphoetae]